MKVVTWPPCSAAEPHLAGMQAAELRAAVAGALLHPRADRFCGPIGMMGTSAAGG